MSQMMSAKSRTRIVKQRWQNIWFGSTQLLAEEHHNSSWIRKSIFMRECIRFTPVAEDPKKPDPIPEDPKCQCGNRRSTHDDRFCNNPDPNVEWKPETHTHTCPTNAYGEIEFIGAAGAGLGLKLSKYVRVDHNSPSECLMQLLKTQWKLKTPKLLISVTGGANNFHLNTKLKHVFRKGIIKAALSTEAWIITGGTHAGVMKYVGDAIKDYSLASGALGQSNVVAIGIASWGVLDQRKTLTNDKGRFPAYYRMDNTNRTGVLLDPNHTHFILADNGTVGKFGVEIKLRGKLEKAISEQKLLGNKNVSVPVVCVVVEGGPNTIATVCEAVMNGTPAVIVSGSGRAADILAYAIQRAPEVERQVKDSAGNIRKEKKVVVNDSFMVRLADMVTKAFGDEELDIHLSRIKAMIKLKHLIIVYELGVGDIDSAILHALFTAYKGSVQDQLQLAQVWNRVDVARTEIFTENIDWKKGELVDALHYALVNNQPDFVNLFMENGVSLKDYLTVRELTLLYNEVTNKILYGMLEKHRVKCDRRFNLTDVGKVIRELTMDTYKPLYLRDSKKYQLSESDIAQDRDRTAEGGDLAETISSEFRSPVRELFLYAVLQNWSEMARMFWEEGSEAIASALTASKILTSLAQKESDPDHRIATQSHANFYEELALGVLHECYSDNQVRTCLLLVREQENWGNTTSLHLAKQADNKNFIAHTGVQYLLTEIWNGKLSDRNSQWLLWMCTCIPLLIPFVVKFREDVQKNDDAISVQPNESPQKQAKILEGNGNVEMSDIYTPMADNVNDENGVVEVDDSITETVNPEQPDAKEYQETSDIDITNSGKKLAWWQRFSLFYDTPRITFRHNVLSYLVFLALFSYIILVNFKAEISYFEIILVVWVGSLYLEEMRQIAQGETNSWKIRFLSWLTDYWNMVDIATLILFTLGFVMRFFYPLLDYARIILALDLAIFYIRILQMFSVSKNLGPKLIMIAKMMVDLAFFVAILSVFLIAYGVASQAILYPNTTSLRELFLGVFFKSYFQMYGELFLEDIEGDGCTNNATLIEAGAARCPEFSSLGLILLAVYMMLSNVLLLNLLIAMFSYTFSAVQENTDVFWRFQRYDLIKEYFNRPALVPPFIIISHVFFLIRFLIQKIFKCCLKYRIGEMTAGQGDHPSLRRVTSILDEMKRNNCGIFANTRHFKVQKQRLSKSQVKQLVLWETFQTDEYVTRENDLSHKDIANQVLTTGGRVEDLLGKVEELFADPETGAPSKALGLLGGKAMEERLNRLEDQMERTNQAVDWIITALIDNQLGSKDGPPVLKELKAREEDDNVTWESDQDSKETATVEELGIILHQKARSSPYPGSAIKRFHVPDQKVPWEVTFRSYKPVNYTAPSILKGPYFADEDLLSMSSQERPILNFNTLDESANYDRRSFMQNYKVVDGVPQNPRGRTGMIGRGLLGRFGPNHAADPIVTRWKKNASGDRMADNGLNVLEFVAIQRKDNQQWAIPGGMVEPGGVVSETLKREFGEEAMGSMDKSEQETAQIQKKIEELFQHGVEIYKGYVDDPRNTDNAWMETMAMNFHDEEGTSVALLELKAGDDAQSVRWQRVSSNIPLFANHQAMLRKVAELHNAAF